MRVKIIDFIKDIAGKFVYFNLYDIFDFVRDLVGCKKWKLIFGNSFESKIDYEGIFLFNFVVEYKSCKDKEINKVIRF